MGETKSRERQDYIRFKVVFSSIGIVSGLSIFISFLIEFWNYNAAIWGLASGLFAAIVLHLHVLYLRHTLFRVYSSKGFDFMLLTGGITSLACLIAFCGYVTLAAITKQGYELYGYGYAPAAVFTLLTLKWTAALLYESRKYKRMMLEDAEVKNLFSSVAKSPEASSNDAISNSTSVELTKSSTMSKT